MLGETVFQTTICCDRSTYPGLTVRFEEELPTVPVLPTTLLLLELAVQEPFVDLTKISNVILSDLGATLQLFRMASRENNGLDVRPARLEDCIADLSLEACLAAISRRAVSCDSRRGDTLELWEHSRVIARHARLLAEDAPRIHPDEAYLVGLLHALGSLPSTLGWTWHACQGNAALEMATRWSLPEYVVEAFCEMNASETGASPWCELLRMAHLDAGDPPNRASIELNQAEIATDMGGLRIEFQ